MSLPAEININGTLYRRVESEDRAQTLKDVCLSNGLLVREATGRSRDERTHTRRVGVMRDLRDLGWSFTEIGKALKRDHTTILQILERDDLKRVKS